MHQNRQIFKHPDQQMNWANYLTANDNVEIIGGELTQIELSHFDGMYVPPEGKDYTSRNINNHTKVEVSISYME